MLPFERQQRIDGHLEENVPYQAEPKEYNMSEKKGKYDFNAVR